MSELLKSCYTIKDLDQLEINLDTKHQIQDLILSPRSTYIKKSNRGKGFGRYILADIQLHTAYSLI